MVSFFNKYGSIDEKSDTESNDDDYNGKTDESADESQDETVTQDGSSYMITDKITDESIVDISESGSHATAYSTEDEKNS